MTRVFPVFAALSTMLMLLALLLGLNIGDLYAQPEPSEETLHSATLHRLTGITAALAVVFVESVAVTYFIGTSRWCKEVVETYRFDRAYIVASNRLKRQTFAWALAGMLTVVGIISLGGAADPASTIQHDWRAWVFPHMVAAFAGMAFIIWTYLAAWNNIAANHTIIREVSADVARVRQDLGLEDSPANPSGGHGPIT
jgi:hypothetical protein